MPNPLSDLNYDERKQVFQEIAQNSEKAFQESLSKISEITKHYDPITLLAILSTYGLTVGVGDKGIQKKKDSDFQIYQSYVELFQAIALQFKPDDLGIHPPSPEVVQELMDALTSVMRAFSYRRLNILTELDSDEEKSVVLLQEMIRGNTQIVRNWGYFSQVKSISQEIYGHFDGLLLANYGFSASNAIALFLLLMKKIEVANSDRHQIFSKLYKSKSKEELISKYYELMKEPAEHSQTFMERIDIKSIPFKSLFALVLSHYDLRLGDTYEFYPEDLAIDLGVDEAIVRKVFENFSYEFGDLEAHETEYLFLSNPIWVRPIIKIGNDKYFCVFPLVFFSFIFHSLNSLVEEIDAESLSQRRSEYLQEKVVEIIKRRFPESKTIPGLKWNFHGTEYETDLITFLDSHAIIVEVKSGKITDPALRGAPARLKKHIEEILVAPNLQSKRLKEKLEDLINNPGKADPLRKKLPVGLNDIHKIIRVSVSLEDFGSIQCNISELSETGWLPDDFKPCPTMNLADFETLFDFLEHPVQILHYLEMRQEMEGSIRYTGDELDLMGFYIQTLFNLDNLDPTANLVISEMSSPLDHFYNSRDAGVDIPKPKPVISRLFSRIITQLENRNTPRWTEIGVILNRFSPEDQRQIERKIEKLKSNVRKKWMVEGHKNMLVLVPPKNSEYAFCYVLYNDKNENRKKEFIEGAARIGLDPDNVKRCLVIAKNMDRDDLAYHFIGMFNSAV